MKILKNQFIQTLVFILVITNLSSQLSFAETKLEDNSYNYFPYAQKLSEIGVFVGTGNGFELYKEPTRIEALVILIRLLGKEEDAELLINEPTHFVDVPDWGRGYVNYAFDHGLTLGISDNEFGSELKIQSRSFTTYILRSLGYDDSKGDFAWIDANEFGRKKGVIDEVLFDEMTTTPFIRNQVAKLSYNALKTQMKVMNKSDIKTLGQYLVDLGNIDQGIARNISVLHEEEAITAESILEESITEEIITVETILEEAITEETILEEAITEENITEKPILEEAITVEAIIEEPITVETSLLGEATATKEVLANWARRKGMSQEGIDLIDIYYELCEKKNLNPVIQYMQMCLETGWLYKVKSQAGINSSYHNPCGLKTTYGGYMNTSSEFTMFDSWYEGIDAHTDHSALYAGVVGYPRADTKDPRHFSYLFGKVTTVEGLSGTWAEAGYHLKVLELYDELVN